MHWSLVWLGYLLTWAAIPHILLRNKPPASTLAWVWAVILFPYVGPFFYLIFGTDRLVRQQLRATRAMDATGARKERPITEHTEALVEKLPPAEQPVVEVLSQLNEFAVSAAEETRLLVDGGQFSQPWPSESTGHATMSMLNFISGVMTHAAGKCSTISWRDVHGRAVDPDLYIAIGKLGRLLRKRKTRLAKSFAIIRAQRSAELPRPLAPSDSKESPEPPTSRAPVRPRAGGQEIGVFPFPAACPSRSAESRSVIVQRNRKIVQSFHFD